MKKDENMVSIEYEKTIEENPENVEPWEVPFCIGCLVCLAGIVHV